MKILKKNTLKIVIFTGVKNRCMLHGRVFVMSCFSSYSVCIVSLFYMAIVERELPDFHGENKFETFSICSSNLPDYKINSSQLHVNDFSLSIP